MCTNNQQNFNTLPLGCWNYSYLLYKHYHTHSFFFLQTNLRFVFSLTIVQIHPSSSPRQVFEPANKILYFETNRLVRKKLFCLSTQNPLPECSQCKHKRSKKSGSPPETQVEKIRLIPVRPELLKLEEWQLTRSTGPSSCSQAQSCPQTSPSGWWRGNLEVMKATLLSLNVNVNVNVNVMEATILSLEVKKPTIMSARLQKYALISFFSLE